MLRQRKEPRCLVCKLLFMQVAVAVRTDISMSQQANLLFLCALKLRSVLVFVRLWDNI